jgi:uncharacterized protein YjhX (UPF0386 family)
MKIVNTPQQTAHLFANKLQSEARTQTKNLFFYNEKIYSYGHHFCIAKHYKGELLFTLRSYSNTTAKHIAHVRNASSHINKIYCYYPDGSHDQNFTTWIYEAEKNIDKLANARKPEKYIFELQRINEYAQKYAKALNTKIPALLSKITDISEKKDISEYLAKKQKIADKEARKLAKIHKENLNKWRNFEISTLYQRNGFDYLRFNKEKQRFETSQRIEIPLQLGLKLYDKIKNGIQFEKVLDYTVKEINKNFVEIGCHKITIKEINQIIKTI